VDYAGKLTFKINNSHTLESTISADPSPHEQHSVATLNANDKTANSAWNYGTRTGPVRYDGAFGSSFLVDGAFTWSWNTSTRNPSSTSPRLRTTHRIYFPTQRGSLMRRLWLDRAIRLPNPRASRAT